MPIVLHVAPNGTDDGDGSAARPFASLTRAQAAVRQHNGDHDVTVRIAAGTYRLATPLRFTVAPQPLQVMLPPLEQRLPPT